MIVNKDNISPRLKVVDLARFIAGPTATTFGRNCWSIGRIGSTKGSHAAAE
jgi:hypothetical protein